MTARSRERTAKQRGTLEHSFQCWCPRLIYSAGGSRLRTAGLPGLLPRLGIWGNPGVGSTQGVSWSDWRQWVEWNEIYILRDVFGMDLWQELFVSDPRGLQKEIGMTNSRRAAGIRSNVW